MKTSFPPRIRMGYFMSAALVVLSGVVVTILLFLHMHQGAEKSFQRYFASDAAVGAKFVADELNHAYTHFHSLGMLVEGEDAFEQKEFRNAARLFITEDFGFRTIQWVPRVMDGERSPFEQKVRKGVSKDYMIMEYNRQGSLVPAGRRSEYYPVLYIEPLSGNEKTPGYDLGMGQIELSAMEKARDTGKAFAAEPAAMQSGRDEGPVIQIFYPIYQRGMPVDAVMEKRAALRGFLIVTLSAAKVMRAAIEHSQPQNMHMELIDLSSSRGRQTLYRWAPMNSFRSDDLALAFLYPELPVYRDTFVFAGRDMQVFISAGSIYLAHHYSLGHWLVLPMGFLFTIILSLSLQSNLSRHARAMALVRSRTAELALSEQKYRGLFEQSKDGVVLCDLSGRVTDANQSTLSLLGYTIEEITGRPYLDFVPSKWHELDAEVIRTQLFKKGYSEFSDRECIRKDGSVIPVRGRAWVIRDGTNGKVTGVSLWFRDATDLRKQELEALRNQARMESLLRITRTHFTGIQALLDFSLDEAIKLTDSRIGYIYHYDDVKREFILNTWSRDVMEECTVRDRENLTRYDLDRTGIWGEAVRQARPIVVNDYQASNPLKKGYPQGHVSLHRFLTIPVLSGNRIVAVIGLANKDADYDETDVKQITLLMNSVWQIIELKRAEDAVQDLEQRYRSLFENSHAVMIVLDPASGDIVDANPAACEYYGYEKSEMISKKIMEINTLSPEKVEVEMQRAKLRQARSFNFRHRLKSGEVRDVEVFSGPVHSGDKVLLYSIIQDITERRQAEKALKESQNMLQLVLDSIPVRVFWKDRGLNYLGCNRLFASDAGLSSPNEIIGKSDFDLSWGSYVAEDYRRDDRHVIETALPKIGYEEPR